MIGRTTVESLNNGEVAVAQYPLCVKISACVLTTYPVTSVPDAVVRLA
ncbi:hypothetical protein BH10ACT6_BH10ACT6_15870 [soil metagenome]